MNGPEVLPVQEVLPVPVATEGTPVVLVTREREVPEGCSHVSLSHPMVHWSRYVPPWGRGEEGEWNPGRSGRTGPFGANGPRGIPRCPSSPSLTLVGVGSVRGHPGRVIGWLGLKTPRHRHRTS